MFAGLLAELYTSMRRDMRDILPHIVRLATKPDSTASRELVKQVIQAFQPATEKMLFAVVGNRATADREFGVAALEWFDELTDDELSTLTSVALNRSEVGNVRTRSRHLLLQRPNRPAKIEPLLSNLTDDDEQVSAAARATLVVLGSGTSRAVGADPRDPGPGTAGPRHRGARPPGRRASSAAPMLIEILQDQLNRPTADARAAAADALGRISAHPGVVDALEMALGDAFSFRVQDAAIEALGRIGPEAAPAIDRLSTMGGLSGSNRMAGMIAIGKIRTKAAAIAPQFVEWLGKDPIDFAVDASWGSVPRSFHWS